MIVLAKLVVEAFNKEQENKLYKLYVAIYPSFDEKTFLNFEQFKKEVTIQDKQANVKKQTRIIEIAERIRMKDESRISRQ